LGALIFSGGTGAGWAGRVIEASFLLPAWKPMEAPGLFPPPPLSPEPASLALSREPRQAVRRKTWTASTRPTPPSPARSSPDSPCHRTGRSGGSVTSITAHRSAALRRSDPGAGRHHRL